MVIVQSEEFDIEKAIESLTAKDKNIGGLCFFVGKVRDFSNGNKVSGVTIEHYPNMTEKALSEIEIEARDRWPILASLIIHRYGRLKPGENIVLVATAAAHREPTFQSCNFIMDWLKTKAPFWKKEQLDNEELWVKSKYRDTKAATRWDMNN